MRARTCAREWVVMSVVARWRRRVRGLGVYGSREAVGSGMSVW